jgi:hypothetical protein
MRACRCIIHSPAFMMPVGNEVVATARSRPAPRCVSIHSAETSPPTILASGSRCDEAGLPESCVPHGLRKAGCRIMAESDCTPHEIMGVSGHTTLKEVERYTKAFNRKKAAARAQAKVAAAKDNVVPLVRVR